ncbi:hypothetical protein D9M73_170170 [compost metagenome]
MLGHVVDALAFQAVVVLFDGCVLQTHATAHVPVAGNPASGGQLDPARALQP